MECFIKLFYLLRGIYLLIGVVPLISFRCNLSTSKLILPFLLLLEDQYSFYRLPRVYFLLITHFNFFGLYSCSFSSFFPSNFINYSCLLLIVLVTSFLMHDYNLQLFAFDNRKIVKDLINNFFLKLNLFVLETTSSKSSFPVFR